MANKGYAGANEGMKGETGEREPKGSKSADTSGERKGKITNGVGMGKADATGRTNGVKDKGEMNTGRSEKVIYTHKKGCY